MEKLRTRAEYLAGEVSHRAYYAQFITEDTKREIHNRIGLIALRNSKDEHLNDIPLGHWDLLGHYYDSKKFAAAEQYGLTQAAWVCIAKEAARQIIEESQPQLRTAKMIEYTLGADGYRVMIPKGTRVIPADNLPQPNDSDIAYWVEPWPHMSERAKSHMRTYGFGVSASQVV